MKKLNQQSRSGWGGQRTGAGAPVGNTNAVKHGERSRRAFSPPAGCEQLSPLELLPIRNLIITVRMGELWRTAPISDPAAWRELMLLDGMIWQHILRKSKSMLSTSRLELRLAKSHLAQSKAARRSDSKK
ncbi:hypothetical protein [Serratia liquefaciens]|uniref:Uncharacterized protein n=1 Tax=Serratia liquefaciens TaxID=614 RepID=A0A515D2R3_SERLI|nr:hypothetical protein [Serratia liquefaciens]QDL34650.1 hypothetical protein EGO53_24025 [Serratia liquefaciens]